MENCYAAAPVSSPTAGGIVGGGQNSTTPGSLFSNVIAWNPTVDGTTALPFGTTIELDVLNPTYIFADMLVNGEPVEDGLSHLELCDIVGTWGEPWWNNTTVGNGYPILRWQYERGDYREICGFDPDNIPTGITAIQDSNRNMMGEIYNLSGQRLQKMQRGINIVNGRKVIVK